MKSRSLLLITLLGLAGIGFDATAGELYVPQSYVQPTVPAKTRAEVKAETLRALKDHEVPFGDATNYPEIEATPTLDQPTRAEVKAETLHALKNHEVEFGDATGYPNVAAQPSTETRAQVKADTVSNLKERERTRVPEYYAN
jgi:hypothetical protein